MDILRMPPKETGEFDSDFSFGRPRGGRLSCFGSGAVPLTGLALMDAVSASFAAAEV